MGWELLYKAPYDIVVDVEHLPNVAPAWENLLGVSVSWAGLCKGVYIPCRHWENLPSRHLTTLIDPFARHEMGKLLADRRLSGWNIEHDREWVNACFRVNTKWQWDGRILYYLMDSVQNQRGYGLKTAQMHVLGWKERGDAELEEQVMDRGGRLSKGQHYLADLDVLGRYAASDAHSTALVIEKLMTGESWLVEAHDRNRDYAQFLARATSRGVAVDEAQLANARRLYQKEIKRSETRIREVCKNEVEAFEREKRESTLIRYKSERGRANYLATTEGALLFNPRSADHRSDVLHKRLGLPVGGYTETGKIKSDKNTLKAIDHPAAQSFVELSKNEKLLQFATSYLHHSSSGVLRFPHDTCSTVSERLGGYAPYDLNMPFDSQIIMEALRVRHGHVGTHMDLVSIEPCLIAGFSGDEAMLKVYRDGLGDIYLDLCLDLFPLEEAGLYDKITAKLIRDFNRTYRTSAVPDQGVKERFKRLRNVAKIVQLAVGYTGTRFTVAKNLNLAGFPVSIEKAGVMVNRYWERFAKVKTLATKLSNIVRDRGYIEGFYGRRLFVPQNFAKDAMNRFAQHGGHAILRAIVMGIDKEVKERRLDMWPLLPDVHDATSWEGKASFETMRAVFQASIDRVNEELSLPIQVKGEIKQFTTFYGLKHSEAA